MKADSTQYQCQNGSLVAHDEGHMVDCLQIRTVEKAVDKGLQEVKAAEPTRRPSPPKTAESRDSLTCGAATTGRSELPPAPENLPQEESGSKAPRAAKNPSPKARRGSTNTPSPPAGRTEKKQRVASKAPSPNWDGTDYSAEQTRCGAAPLCSSVLKCR